MKLFKSKKGMTLIETIIAMAVLAIVSVPLMAVFTNAAVIVKKTNDRLEINAVTRIIKENVINSVKYGGGNTIKSSETGLEIDLQSVEDGTNLEIKGSKGDINTKYIFDAERTVDFDNLSYSASSSQKLADTCEYLITLKTMDGDAVQRLRILINKVD